MSRATATIAAERPVRAGVWCGGARSPLHSEATTSALRLPPLALGLGGGVRQKGGDPFSLPDYGRPLLRPVIFVRATVQKTLFEQVDEVIQAHDITLDQDESGLLDVFAFTIHIVYSVT